MIWYGGNFVLKLSLLKLEKCYDNFFLIKTSNVRLKTSNLSSILKLKWFGKTNKIFVFFLKEKVQQIYKSIRKHASI